MNEQDRIHLTKNIREQYRYRQDLLRAAKRLGNQIGAICRRHTGEGKSGGGKRQPTPKATALQKRLTTLQKKARKGKPTFFTDETEEVQVVYTWAAPLLDAFLYLEEERAKSEKELTDLAKKLPAYPWVESVEGFGALSFAQIIGESGDLCRYSTPAKLWTRMCVGRKPNPDGSWSNQGFIKDGAPRIKGKSNRASGKLITHWLDDNDRPYHWYNAERRSLVYLVSENLMKLNHDGYRELYETKKAHYEEVWGKPQMRCHLGALRVVGKRLLRDLWVVWRNLDHA